MTTPRLIEWEAEEERRRSLNRVRGLWFGLGYVAASVAALHGANGLLAPAEGMLKFGVYLFSLPLVLAAFVGLLYVVAVGSDWAMEAVRDWIIRRIR